MYVSHTSRNFDPSIVRDALHGDWIGVSVANHQIRVQVQATLEQIKLVVFVGDN